MSERRAGVGSRLREAIERVLGEPYFEFDPLGIRVLRERVRQAQLRDIERLLSEAGSVRILDFRIGLEDLEENLVSPAGGALGAYAGIATPAGTRVFRVDHHFDRPELDGESTTPLVLRYLRALRESGREAVLREFSRALYLADHADPDILFANYLAHAAETDESVLGPLGDRFAAAAVRNDYIRLPDPADEPFASRLYYAGLGLENSILGREAGFAETLRERLPHAGAWLEGRAPAGVAREFDRFEATSRALEADVLRKIAAWEAAGLLRLHAGGRIAYLEAPDKIDNSDLFLYFLTRAAERPEIQILRYGRTNRSGAPGPVYMYKFRAHGGRSLVPVFERLKDLVPAAGIDGRPAAGGSRTPIPEIPRDELIEAVRSVLDGRPPSSPRK